MKIKKRSDGTFESTGKNPGSVYYSMPGESKASFLKRLKKDAFYYKIKTPNLRTPYYELADAVNGFKSATIGTDYKLKELAQKMDEIGTQIYKHLNENYIWD